MIPATFSAGVATYPGDPKDRYELISLAEEAALRADEHGGVRTMFGRAPTMTTKTSHYSPLQLERLRLLREKLGRSDASLLREALDDLLRKYDQRDTRRGLSEAVADYMSRIQARQERSEPDEPNKRPE
jgi:GGDEF domain-containing protein